MKDKDKFKECDACSKLPGSPPLCNGCLNNRMLIEKLKSSNNENLRGLRSVLVSIINDIGIAYEDSNKEARDGKLYSCGKTVAYLYTLARLEKLYDILQHYASKGRDK